jgi:hypothetical protein
MLKLVEAGRQVFLFFAIEKNRVAFFTTNVDNILIEAVLIVCL